MTYSSLIILYIADSFGNTISSINLITNLEVGTILQFKFYSRIWRNVKKYVFFFVFLDTGWMVTWLEFKMRQTDTKTYL